MQLIQQIREYINGLRTLYQAYLLWPLFFIPATLWAQGLEGRITDIISDLTRILNVIIVGFIAWAGFLIAKGDGSGINRLIYGVIGLVVVNASYLIINYFR